MNNSSVGPKKAALGQQIRMYPHQSARFCDAEGLLSSFAEDQISTDQKPFSSVHSVNRRYTLKGVQGAPHPFTGTLKVLFKSWTHKARIKHTCQSLTLIGTFVVRDCFPLCTESASTNTNSGLLAQSGYYFNPNFERGQQRQLPFPTHQVPQQCSSSLIVPGWTLSTTNSQGYNVPNNYAGSSEQTLWQSLLLQGPSRPISLSGELEIANDIPCTESASTNMNSGLLTYFNSNSAMGQQIQFSTQPVPHQCSSSLIAPGLTHQFSLIHRLPGASQQPALQRGESRRPDDIPPQGPSPLKHSIDRILGTSQQNALQHFPSNDLDNSVASMSHSNPPPQNQSNLEPSESGGTQASSHEKHKCNECGKGFRYSSRLKEHIATKHNGKDFRCTICDFSCTSRNGLYKHRVHKHGLQRSRKHRFPKNQ